MKHRLMNFCYFQFFLYVFCLQAQENPPPQVQTTTKKEPLSSYESTFYPPLYNESLIEIERLIPQQPTPDSTTALDSSAAAASQMQNNEMVQGFRIQIGIASNPISAANDKLSAARLLEKDSVYIVFDPPLYKIRVGDYTTRFDATKKLESVIKAGYPDAWIVPDRVRKRLAEQR
jgi:hypothetical protein